MDEKQKDCSKYELYESNDLCWEECLRSIKEMLGKVRDSDVLGWVEPMSS